MMLVVREKPQGFFSPESKLVLPDSKLTSSKVALALASGPIKHDNWIQEPWIEPGERGMAVQYDVGHLIQAWEDLEFIVPFSMRINEKRLPDGVTIKNEGQISKKVEIAPDVEAFINEPAYTRISVKKGTNLQVWVGPMDDIKAVVPYDMEIAD